MINIQNLINEIDETNLSREVGIHHDHARISYQLHSNTVNSFAEFTSIIGDYYNHHFSTCISSGGSLSDHEAASKAKELLERHYDRQNGDIVTAFNDAYNGTNSGLRSILDIIADGLKVGSMNRYIRNVFDQMIAPNRWEDKVEIIRQFIEYCGFQFSTALHKDQAERYASNYKGLIQAYVNGLKETSSIFRRL